MAHSCHKKAHISCQSNKVLLNAGKHSRKICSYMTKHDIWVGLWLEQWCQQPEHAQRHRLSMGSDQFSDTIRTSLINRNYTKKWQVLDSIQHKCDYSAQLQWSKINRSVFFMDCLNKCKDDAQLILFLFLFCIWLCLSDTTACFYWQNSCGLVFSLHKYKPSYGK